MRRIFVAVAIVVVMLAAFTATAYAQEQGDITQFGSDVTVRQGETIDGNVTVFGGDVTIDGRVDGNVTIFGGNLRINGRANGDVTNIGGDSTLGSNAVIDGNFMHIGGTTTKAPGAEIRGTETTGIRFLNPFATFLSGLLSLAFSLLITAAVVALFPRQTTVLADTVERDALRSAGIGVIATILIPVVFIVLALLIIVGWILIPFVALAVGVIYYFGYIGVATWLGRRIIDATHIVQQSPIAQALIGVLILGLIGLIPILGWLVVLAASLIGVGAVLLSKFGTGRPWLGGRATTQAPPPAAESGRGAA